MASFVSNGQAQVMIEKSNFYQGEVKVRLHTGNPGKTGEENKAKETNEKAIPAKNVGWTEPGVLPRAIKTIVALEWPEVKETETYKFFSLWVGGVFLGYGEFTAPIAVEKGDTFKINKENMTVEIEE